MKDGASALESRMERGSAHDVEMLERIQRRVLWLSIYMVHYANFVREASASKVGGHQASSSSVVTLLTALYFRYLRPGDLVSIKPHASPVFHAIQFLRGLLPKEKLAAFRQFGGLQAYPSRTKDVDGVDFSTGSVGLGAVAPIFGALVRDYITDHFGDQHSHPRLGWQIALVGDAELDEGNVWEALGEEFTRRLSRVLWVIDLNRQSLDRVIPDGRAQRLRETFRTNGWEVIDLKYGKRLEAVFRRPNGMRLRALIDEMSNEEYQSLLLKEGEIIRARLASRDPAITELLAPYSPAECKELFANLGGHDLESVLEAYDRAFAIEDRPVVIFAYTIKGWGLPIAGNPANHARLLRPAEIAHLQQELAIPPGEEFSGFAPDSEEARYIREAMEARGWHNDHASPAPRARLPEIPSSLGLRYSGAISTQSAMGSVLVNLARIPELAPYLVTASPDVAMSTNLGGWIHRVGIYSRRPDAKNYFKELGIALLIDWKESPRGQHIELGISENNLFMLLAILGLSANLYGQPLLPIGTVYDPFVCRALDAFIYGLYSGSRFIVLGTPSGVSLSYEGGAHQSTITPGIGVQLPGVASYEPAFGQEVEWILLDALGKLHDPEGGRSAYLRLSTKPVDQGIFNSLLEQRSEDELREQILKGAYRLIDRSAERDYSVGDNVVHIFGTGAMIPEAVAAAEALNNDGIFANVFVITSADVLFHEHLAAAQKPAAGGNAAPWLARLLTHDERSAPLVTVHDGHPLTLAALGGALSMRMANLGVTTFGQTGSPEALYRVNQIAPADIAAAARTLLD
jgi:pyruvate dehydrogenase E1 component